MSKLIEGLARRLVEREALPRRDFLTGRRTVATAGAVVPLVGAAGAVAGGAPRAGVAARSSKAPPLPARSDLRAIHVAVMSSEARLKSELIALVEALKTPASDGTFSTTAKTPRSREHGRRCASSTQASPGPVRHNRAGGDTRLPVGLRTDAHRSRAARAKHRSEACRELTSKIRKLGKGGGGGLRSRPRRARPTEGDTMSRLVERVARRLATARPCRSSGRNHLTPT